jgi:hypothetical protein
MNGGDAIGTLGALTLAVGLTLLWSPWALVIVGVLLVMVAIGGAP